MKKLIVANWKAYVNSLKEADVLFEIAREAHHAPYDLVMCPPFPYLLEARRLGVPVFLGSQDISIDMQGAHTSGVSPLLLKDAGVGYAIIGHSERRTRGETDEIVNKKMRGAFQAGLYPILCVGEPAHIRREGMEATRNFIYTQLKKDLDSIPNSKFQIPNSLIIAYEPLWAISVNGKGASDKPEDTVQVITVIKEFLDSKFQIPNSKVLYGGSVNSSNILDFLSHQEIDGALIGKASTEPEEFKKILESLK